MPFDINPEIIIDLAPPSPALIAFQQIRKLFGRSEQWSQSFFHEVDEDGTDRFCLRGAMHHVSGGSCLSGFCAHKGPKDEVKAYRPLVDMMEMLIELGVAYFRRQPYQHIDIVTWNDDPNRTHQDVLRLIDLIIAWESGLERDKFDEVLSFG